MPDVQQHLSETLGLNERIVQLFTTRKRPEGNEYWLSQENYMSTSPGFVFIPIYFDLLIRQGVSADDLLVEDLLVTMEQILKSAGKQEYGKLSHEVHVNECREVLRKVGTSDHDIEATERLLVNRDFKKIPIRFRALRRANTFLYTFAGRKFDLNLLFSTWEMTLPLFLMLDDFSDVSRDMETGDENCLLDGGAVTENFFELSALVDKLLADVAAINPALGAYLSSVKREAVARNMMLIMTMGSK